MPNQIQVSLHICTGFIKSVIVRFKNIKDDLAQLYILITTRYVCLVNMSIG